ncbi:hypothetical protein [Sinomonas halotolerans]|uniref:Mucin-associated surface protein n=1 Tax=Sinomonas halotolerans TaxID=1644133 RepID=A0ABU9WYJ2_9MICC
MRTLPWGPLRAAGAAFAVAALLATAGCAGSGSALDREAASGLQTRAADVRAAAAQGDPAAVHDALDALEADVRAGASEGRIGAEREARILGAIETLRKDFPLPSPTPTPSQTATPTEEPEEPEEPQAPGKDGKGEGDRGKGKGKD